MALGKFKMALRDFEAVRKARPKDSTAIVSSHCYLVSRQCSCIV